MTIHVQRSFSDSLEAREQPLVENTSASFFSLRNGIYRTAGKRAFDIVFVIAVAPVALLLIGVIALLMRAGGSKPFYLQDRVGQDGKVFRLLKLQTMVPNAQNALDAHLRDNPAARREWDQKQKLVNDPRITRIGTILRKTSMDELPQLWNVLKGDMAIVGPRPMMVDQRPLYPGRAYYRMRPGITGLWQVEARNNCDFSIRADFDDLYEDRISLKTDLDILLRTVRVVLNCTGH